MRCDLAAGQGRSRRSTPLRAGSPLDHALIDPLEPAADDQRCRAPWTSSAATFPCVNGRPARAHQEARTPVIQRRLTASMRAGEHVGASSPCRGPRSRACRRPSGVCRVACALMSTDVERPQAGRERPAGEAGMPSGPGNMSGKMVSTLARHMSFLPGREWSSLVNRSFLGRYRRRSDRTGDMSTDWHGRFGERQHHRCCVPLTRGRSFR